MKLTNINNSEHIYRIRDTNLNKSQVEKYRSNTFKNTCIRVRRPLRIYSEADSICRKKVIVKKYICLKKNSNFLNQILDKYIPLYIWTQRRIIRMLDWKEAFIHCFIPSFLPSAVRLLVVGEKRWSLEERENNVSEPDKRATHTHKHSGVCGKLPVQKKAILKWTMVHWIVT